ncbi:hypothetical protein TUM19329_34740 [Legionella antarctica]|uniref:Lipoprotein n=1 Tax=Legionella antarctica TaxID=2708020 RepID=A0A6F8TA41_9GAMM|nr:hypothetical protein [Legionella antarctica]BCA97113.1 hypothetical protein TUM19329_34740 [Legionella antarctica]
MMNLKKWGYGIVVSLVFGVSGCYMDGRNPQADEYTPRQTMKQNTGATKTNTNSATKEAVKSSSSKEPAQRSTPGPKQTAAPQLPVIQ